MTKSPLKTINAEALDCREGETWRFTVIDRKRILLEREEDKNEPRVKGKRIEEG